MAGKLKSDADKGRCARCEASEVKPNGQRQCNHYGNACQRVAWNCPAPPQGYKLAKKQT